MFLIVVVLVIMQSSKISHIHAHAHTPPVVNTLDSIVRSVSHTDGVSNMKGDAKFLKKMNAHLIVDNFGRSRCSIGSFVKVSRKRKGRDSPEEHIVDDQNTTQEWKCDSCNTELVYIRKDAQKVCPSCGRTSFFQIMTKSDMISQGHIPVSAYLYKRLNHFKTWLKRTQGKETTTISNEVVELVRKELKKERISDMNAVDHQKVKAILKKLRQSKYYNHSVQITTIISGKIPPQMSAEQEDSLIQMFDRIQEPFEKIILGKSRQNMLSYSFLIHKFLEILTWDEYLPYFPLLVSADKISRQDEYWKLICEECGFEFIRSTF